MVFKMTLFCLLLFVSGIIVALTTELCLQVSTVRRCWFSLSSCLISGLMRLAWPSNTMRMGRWHNSNRCRKPCLKTHSYSASGHTGDNMAATLTSSGILWWCNSSFTQCLQYIKCHLNSVSTLNSLTWSYWRTSPAQGTHKRATRSDAESDSCS